MASDISLNGTVFSGNPNNAAPWRPSAIEEVIDKAGVVIVAENGNRTLVQRAIKRGWSIHWKATNETTRAALAALAVLATAFTYSDEHGTSYTVQIEPGDHQCATAYSNTANAFFYNIDLTIHEA